MLSQTAIDGLSNAATASRQLRVERRSVVVNIVNVDAVVEASSVPVGDLRSVERSVGRDDGDLVEQTVIYVDRAERIDAGALSVLVRSQCEHRRIRLRRCGIAACVFIQ